MAEQSQPDKLPRWADVSPTFLTEPGEGKKDAGWIGERPPANYWNWLALKTYQWLVYLKLRLLATVGLQADTELTIASGSVTPTQGNHTIDTEADAGTDDLANIVTTNLDDGRLLLIRADNSARDVVVKHAAGGAGQVHLYSGVDFTLTSTASMLMLKRVGADWYEMSRTVVSDSSGNRMLVVTATGNGTWLCPEGVFSVVVDMQAPGGGGGGGDFDGTGRPGGGGGSGAWVRKRFAVVPGTTYNFHVGTAGAAGTNTPTDGGDGDDTWFGSNTSGNKANGGKGGKKGVAGAAGAGGEGGAAPTFDADTFGSRGWAGGILTSPYPMYHLGYGTTVSDLGHSGAPSRFGRGGGTLSPGTGETGEIGGGGGGGNNLGATLYGGGAGGPGFLVINY